MPVDIWRKAQASGKVGKKPKKKRWIIGLASSELAQYSSTSANVDSHDLIISPNVYSFLPSKTVDLLYALRPSSWTCTIVPKETRPTIVFSGSLAMASDNEDFKYSSSFLSRQVSTMNIKHGALGMFVEYGSWYSTTWGTSLDSPVETQRKMTYSLSSIS